MKMQKISERAWNSSSAGSQPSIADRGYGDGTLEPIPLDRSDFSPVFWLAGASDQGGKPRFSVRPWITFAGRPFTYPLLIGLVLVFSVLAQRYF
jgi:hypothetical protein